MPRINVPIADARTASLNPKPAGGRFSTGMRKREPEPDAAVFTLPESYTVADEKGSFYDYAEEVLTRAC
jgi:hypothetical protein